MRIAALGAGFQWWTNRFIVKQYLAVEAVNAFIWIDMAIWVDRLNNTFGRTNPAFLAALMTPLQPFKHSQPRWYRQRRPERAQIAAKETLDE